MPTSGFQTNTTIHAAFWRYIPDDPTARLTFVEVNSLQYFEATKDNMNVWLYYAASNVPSTQNPYHLTGAVAQAFLSDMGALFV